MATKEELENMYSLTEQCEKDLVTELEELGAEFKTRLDAIKTDLPAKGTGSAARQFFQRVEQSLNNLFTFDVGSVKMQYGMTSPGQSLITP